MDMYLTLDEAIDAARETFLDEHGDDTPQVSQLNLQKYILQDGDTLWMAEFHEDTQEDGDGIALFLAPRRRRFSMATMTTAKSPRSGRRRAPSISGTTMTFRISRRWTARKERTPPQSGMSRAELWRSPAAPVPGAAPRSGMRRWHPRGGRLSADAGRLRHQAGRGYHARSERPGSAQGTP